MTDHITTVMRRYRGKFTEWDVVNEAISEAGGISPHTYWHEKIGDEYIEIAFRAARAADPDAKLFYNDFNIESPGAKQDGAYRLVRKLKQQGLVDGVGFQTHISNAYYLDSRRFAATLRRFVSLGLEVAVTEADVRIHDQAEAQPSKENPLVLQADRFSQAATACYMVAACSSFTVWGITDTYSWFGADQAPLLFDTAYREKPAYSATRSALRSRR